MVKTSKILNFIKAVTVLEEALTISKNIYLKNMKELDKIIRDGVIQRFEFCAELAWKACNEHLENVGITHINGPKAVLKEAFANEIFERVKNNHIILLRELVETFNKN